MNHTEAVESQASEKYLLGELSAELREEYEEHYFSCAECSDELRAAAELLAAGRRISSAAPAREPDYVRPSRGWFPWMNPLVVGPALAAFLLVIAYQNLVSIPRYRKQSAAPQVLPMYSLLSANTRGDRGLVFSVAPGHSFGLYVDIPVDPAYSTYLLRLESPGGSTPLRSLSSKEAEKTQVIVLNPGRQAGNYALVIAGLTDGADPSSARELARLQFTVELKD